MIRHPLVRLALFLALVTFAFLNQNGTLARWFGAPAATERRAPDAGTPRRVPGEATVTTEAGAPAGEASARRTRPPAPEPERHPRIGFRTRELWMEHYRKHGAEFSASSPELYLKLAQDLRDDPLGPGIRELVRADGVICRFHPRSGAFLAFNPDLTIRTFFRPNDGEAYFRRQLEREP